MEAEEIKLVRQAKKGNREALEKLFLQKKEYLYRTAFLYTKNSEDALDMVQECILQSMLSLKSLKSPEYFYTWITRVMINCIKTEWRKRGKCQLMGDETECLAEERQTDEAEISREEKMDLYDAIDGLDFPYKAIIIQYYFVGSKLSEIAEMLEMPLGTVKAYHARAKSRLREVLEEE